MSDPTASASVVEPDACAAARLKFFREQVDASYNSGAPGIVGEINRRFQRMSHDCITDLPTDRYSVHGDRQTMLALTYLEQAKDAAVKAVILSNAATSEADMNKKQKLSQ